MDDPTYLAAHAPKEIPGWYVPEMEKEKPVLKDPICNDGSKPTDKLKEAILFYVNEGFFEPHQLEQKDRYMYDYFSDWLEEAEKLNEELDKWQIDYKYLREFQWPWAWAKMVLMRKDVLFSESPIDYGHKHNNEEEEDPDLRYRIQVWSIPLEDWKDWSLPIATKKQAIADMKYQESCQPGEKFRIIIEELVQDGGD